MATPRHLQPPSQLNVHDPGVAALWTAWKERWECYSIATKIGEEDATVQASILLTVIGPEAHAVFRTFTWDNADDKNDPEKIIKAFDDYFEPTKHATYERYRFNMRNQEAGETIDQYTTTLRQMAMRCSFDTITEDEILRDRLVFGIQSVRLRERLLREKDLSLETVLSICRASETSAAQLKDIGNAGNIHALQATRSRAGEATGGRVVHKSNVGRVADCKYCGREHQRTKQACPAYGKTCSNCSKANHFAKKCQQRHQLKPKVNMVGVEDQRHVFMVAQQPRVQLSNSQLVTFKLNDKAAIRCQIDSGADCNILPLHVYKPATQDWKLKQVRPSRARLFGFGQQSIQPVGCVTLRLQRGQLEHLVDFQVLNGRQYHSLVGAKTCVAFRLLSMEDNDDLHPWHVQGLSVHALNQPITTVAQLVAKYPQVFRQDGRIGILKGDYNIRIDDSVTPVQQAPRSVSVALHAPLRKELETMVEQGIIAAVTEPTPWVSSMVVVPKKDGRIRICLDPKDLNKAIMREHYPMPTIEDIATRLAGAKVFSILDIKHGFWHVKLDMESSLTTTFNTPFGRYRWCRMPFGISSAPEVFQRRMHQLIEGLDGVEVIADDFMVYGCGATQEKAELDHDAKLHKFLERCEQHNLILNADKVRLRLTEVPFIGHIISAEGLKSSPDKVQAVLEMPIPTDLQGVRRFVGMVQYLAKFLPRLSDMTAPLRMLLKNNCNFLWSSAQQDAFDKIKQAATQLPVLRYFDLRDEVTVQCDASKDGLGAVLLQCGQPVAYASRALTAAETRYAQIEKECLAILFAAERFDHYIYGCNNVTVQSDHKPLEAIFAKPLAAAPARLQRMLLRLQRYNLTVVYLKGSDMVLADALSRAYFRDNSISSFINNLHLVAAVTDVSQGGQRDIKEATQRDADMIALQQIILDGWPSTKVATPRAAQAYFDVRDELTVDNGMVFKGNRIVVPRALRRQMLAKAHDGHVGVEGCLRRLRESLYWPRMSAEAREHMSQCDVCQSVQDAPRKEPMMKHAVPERPWAKIGVDLCDFNGRTLLVVVDYFSNYLEVCRMQQLTSTAVIRALSDIFARWGVPDTVISDNGRQFASAEFAMFASDWGFCHTTSSPHYPQSNGKAENAVRTVKRLFTKCQQAGENEFRALLAWRNTPSAGMDTSPAQRIMGRRCKTTLPTSSKLLQPQYKVSRDVAALQRLKGQQEHYYNRTASAARDVHVGDAVRVRVPGSKIWSAGKCLRKVAPRSVEVEVGGSVYRRNHRHVHVSADVDSGDETIKEETNDVSTPAAKPEAAVDEGAEPLRRSTRSRKPVERYGFDSPKKGGCDTTH